MAIATHIGAAVDHVALGVMRRLFQTTEERRLPQDAARYVAEMRALYARPEWIVEPDRFFVPPEGLPDVVETPRGRVDGGEVVDLAFPSRFVPHAPAMRELFERYPRNATVYARHLRGAPGRPTVVCLHGWAGGFFEIESRVFASAWLYAIGLDVALFVLPFHGGRRPGAARFSGQLFPSGHIARTNEGFAQAVHDLRSLVAWLRARGSPAVGLAGVSLGSYTAALLASLDPLDFVSATIPVTDFADLIWRHGAGRPEHRRAERFGITREHVQEAWRVHSPLARSCRVPPERRLIVAGRGDRIAVAEQAEALWEHWGRCRRHFFDGGHLAQFGRGQGLRLLRELLAEAQLLPAIT